MKGCCFDVGCGMWVDGSWHLAVCPLNCGESPGSGRCDWEGCWPPHLFVDLGRPALAAFGFLSRVDGPAGNDGRREYIIDPRMQIMAAQRAFFGGGPVLASNIGLFLCHLLTIQVNLHSSAVDAMLILIASCFDFLPVSTTNSTTPNSSPSPRSCRCPRV